MEKKNCTISSFAFAFVNGHVLDQKSFCRSCQRPWKEIKNTRCALEFHIRSGRNKTEEG